MNFLMFQSEIFLLASLIQGATNDLERGTCRNIQGSTATI